MCGLAGVIRNKNKEADWKDIWDSTMLFEKILVNAQSRGRHASGYAIINSDGFNLYKRPISASNLIKTKKHLNLMQDNVGHYTHAILGHTRYATQGTPQVSYNNHPIRVGSIIGTHNGSIWNDNELSDKFNFIRNGQVDSEILFHLIESCNLNDFIDNKLPNVNGLISSIWSDIDEPNIIYVLKGNKPLSMVYSSQFDSFFYASLDEHLKDIKGAYPIELNENTLYKIDTDGLSMEEYKINFQSIRPNKIVREFVPRYNYNERLENAKRFKLND